MRRRLGANIATGKAESNHNLLETVGAKFLDTLDEIHLATSSAPVVSIVIPCFGEHLVTRRCLASIAINPPSVPYEVLVADDAYPDPFDASAMGVKGVIHLRSANNRGFLKNCNNAVSQSKAQRVLLLNNDTVVWSGAIDSLLATFDQFDRVGAVGAKLLFADGRLQEAGGIIWQDGSGWNWGREADHGEPAFNYVREVDYCSAAALMVDRCIWDSLSGFDTRYSPAYYEDTDFCFAVRAAGYRVIYQPAAVVTHFEGISHGIDISSGMKAKQVENQVIFRDKWRASLAGHALNGDQPLIERDRYVNKRILWVEACMLTPDQDSGSLRTFRVLDLLTQLDCKVTFIADNLQGGEPYVTQLQQKGIEVQRAPYVARVDRYLEEAGHQFDVIVLCRHYIAIQYVELIRRLFPNTAIWFDTIDLHYLRLRRQFELDQDASTKAMATLAHTEETTLVRQVDHTLVVSNVEVNALATEVPGSKVTIVSNIHEVSRFFPGRDGREHVMFVGGFQHPPNIDAVQYLAREIWPKFVAMQPTARMFVIGSKMPESLRREGQAAGLDMVGYVEDLEPFYTSCVMAVAPLRYGAGVKGKVNQALSYGTPVVGTTMAIEGMNVVDSVDVKIADDSVAFADAMHAVYTDPVLWNNLASNGQQAMAKEFSADVARKQLSDLLASVA